MTKLIINTNTFLKDEKKRRKNILKSQLISFKLEGIQIKKSDAEKIAERVSKKLKKSV